MNINFTVFFISFKITLGGLPELTYDENICIMEIMEYYAIIKIFIGKYFIIWKNAYVSIIKFKSQVIRY